MSAERPRAVHTNGTPPPPAGGAGGTTTARPRPSPRDVEISAPRVEEPRRLSLLHAVDRGEEAPSPRVGEDDVPDTDSFQERAVRALNVAVALGALVVLSPLMLLIAIAIKIDTPGPIFYRQLRIGVDRREPRSRRVGGRRTGDLGGKPFVIYKFRTMPMEAERESGPVWASRDDERTTRVGRFLRKYRLDELPQLWNVLRGDMSVVGPRPERPIYVSYLRREIAQYSKRQRVRPGITGWAQVNQDIDQTLDDVRTKVSYDLDYLRNRSVWFDLRIMLQTPLVMFGRDHILGSRRGSPPERSEAG